MKTGSGMNEEEEKLNLKYLIKTIAEMQEIPPEVAERFLASAGRFHSQEEIKDENK